MFEKFSQTGGEEPEEQVGAPGFELRDTTDILENEIARIEAFKPSGDINKDVEEFLKLTGRERYLEDTTDLRKLLSEIRDFQRESLDPDSDLHHEIEDGDSQTKKLLFGEIPAAEIAAIDLILSGVDKEEEKDYAVGAEELEIVNIEPKETQGKGPLSREQLEPVLDELLSKVMGHRRGRNLDEADVSLEFRRFLEGLES